MSTDSFDIIKLSAASISKHNCYSIKNAHLGFVLKEEKYKR